MTPTSAKTIATVVGAGVFLINLIAAYLLQPSNIIIFGDATQQQRATILLGLVIVICTGITTVVQNQLPRWQDMNKLSHRKDK